jgi:hypothetical protein
LVQCVGNWRATSKNDEATLRNLLKIRKPSKAIIGKAIKVMREIADRPAAGGTIGKQLTTIKIPSNFQAAVESGYYTILNRHEYYMADSVVLLGDKNKFAFKDIQLVAEDPLTTPPLIVSKVGRNHPCPCGSGKKYKYCHGKR